MHFNPSPSFTLGIEHEVQFIDPRTGDLKPVAIDVLKSIGANSRITSEIFQSMIEVRTGICEDAFEAQEQLIQSHLLLEEHAAKFEALILSTGTHPFSKAVDRKVFPLTRYQNLIEEKQWIARRLQIFGVHVHIGMPSGEVAIKIANRLQQYIPLLLALSANSPYFEGEATGMASARVTLFEAKPTGGHPCIFVNWNHFVEVTQALEKSGSIVSLKDLWWDVRLNPEFGTVEVRIFDSPLSVQSIAAFGALVQSLCQWLHVRDQQELDFPEDWWMRENKWRAARHGFGASILVNRKGDTSSLKNVFEDLLGFFNAHEIGMNYQPFWQVLRKHHQDFEVQKQLIAQNGDMKDGIIEVSKIFSKSLRS